MKIQGESTYGLLRRFLIANYGANINVPEEVKSNSRYYKVLYTALINEEKFIKKFNLKTQPKLYDVIPPSRPIKCCPSCMSLGFHTDLFEYRWLNKCLVHQDDIVTHCPFCRQHWKSYSELIGSNSCNCCGTRFKFQSLFEKLLIDRNKLNVYGFIQNIFKRRDLEFGVEARIRLYLESSNKWYSDIYNLMFDQNISSKSLLNLSIVKSEKSISQFEISQLEKVKIPFVDTIKHTYKLPVKKPFNTSSDNGQGIKKYLCDLDIKYIDMLVKQTNDKQVFEINENDYVFKEGVIKSYTPYIILMILLEKQKAFHYFYSLKKDASKMLLFDFQFEYLRRAHHFIGDINKNLIGDYLKYPYCQLPKELIYKVYTAELWKLCYYSMQIVDGFTDKNNRRDIVKWCELDDLINQVVKASMRSDYTLSMFMSSEKIIVTFPMFILNNKLKILDDEIALIRMSDGWSM